MNNLKISGLWQASNSRHKLVPARKQMMWDYQQDPRGNWRWVRILGEHPATWTNSYTLIRKTSKLILAPAGTRETDETDETSAPEIPRLKTAIIREKSINAINLSLIHIIMPWIRLRADEQRWVMDDKWWVFS